MSIMVRWSEERVAGAAPDQSSLAAARKLAHPGPWSDTGSNDVLVWGKCQGSGKTPYQVSVDTATPAYRCSCPSRKFPCKHALALLLLWARGEAADAGEETADFAQEWAKQREDRAADRERRQSGQQPDPAAQAKRLADRLALMDAGIADFARWLTDLVRTGLAAARNQPYSWWDGVAARLVDAQLPGLADQVRAMGSDVHARTDWADHLLFHAGRWWALTKAWSMREQLTPDEFADLRVALGWATATAEVQGTEALQDRGWYSAHTGAMTGGSSNNARGSADPAEGSPSSSILPSRVKHSRHLNWPGLSWMSPSPCTPARSRSGPCSPRRLHRVDWSTALVRAAALPRLWNRNRLPSLSPRGASVTLCC